MPQYYKLENKGYFFIECKEFFIRHIVYMYKIDLYSNSAMLKGPSTQKKLYYWSESFKIRFIYEKSK